MADIKAKYGTNNQAITITLTALADDGYRASTEVDNTTNLFLDALVQLLINTGNVGAPAGDKNVLVYAYGTSDGGTTYSGGATGVDAAYGAVAGQLITNCKLIGIVAVDAQNETFESDVFSVAIAFGGVLPDHWGIIVMNQVGQTLGTSSAFYQGILAQSV